MIFCVMALFSLIAGAQTDLSRAKGVSDEDWERINSNPEYFKAVLAVQDSLLRFVLLFTQDMATLADMHLYSTDTMKTTFSMLIGDGVATPTAISLLTPLNQTQEESVAATICSIWTILLYWELNHHTHYWLLRAL